MASTSVLFPPSLSGCRFFLPLRYKGGSDWRLFFFSRYWMYSRFRPELDEPSTSDNPFIEVKKQSRDLESTQAGGSNSSSSFNGRGHNVWTLIGRALESSAACDGQFRFGGKCGESLVEVIPPQHHENHHRRTKPPQKSLRQCYNTIQNTLPVESPP
jgi:hypothetical protein